MEPMRGDAFIHFVCGSRRVNIRLGVLLLIPKSPQMYPVKIETTISSLLELLAIHYSMRDVLFIKLKLVVMYLDNPTK